MERPAQNRFCPGSLIGTRQEAYRRGDRGRAGCWLVSGRMEWGPRALGNRSLLCDPRRADMKALLNAKIKRRECFRPFAPSVLEEAVPEWFEEDDAVPFMMQVFQIVSNPRREAKADPRRHTRRRLRASANRITLGEPEVPSLDRELS
jgi:hypothetical protein